MTALKHIAPYLPFSLRFKAKNDVWEMTEINTTSQWKVWAGTEWCCKDLKFKPPINCKDNAKGYGFELHEVKPILRPLSDLTKEIEHNGERFIPIMRIFGGDTYDHDYKYEISIVEKPIVGKRIEISVKGLGSLVVSFSVSNILNNPISYNQWQELLEWHFDIHGLIEKGLAVDINELNNK